MTEFPVATVAGPSAVEEAVPLAATPPLVDPQPVSAFHWTLQIAHRVAAVAFLALLGAFASMLAVKNFHLPLAIAAGCANAALVTALLVMTVCPVARLRREAAGIALFCGAIFLIALVLMLLARLTLIRNTAADFFTPNPPVQINR